MVGSRRACVSKSNSLVSHEKIEQKMAFTKRNPIRDKIDNGYLHIKKLILEYPKLKDSWLADEDVKSRQIAKESADGDAEIEMDIYKNEVAKCDDSDEMLDIFYQSMVLMVYSYYERCVRMFAKDIGTKVLINAICDHKNITLSEDSAKGRQFIDDKFTALRNNICHDNSGHCRKTDLMRSLSKDYKELVFCDNTIAIYDSKLILEALDQEYAVLKELADKLGYKHTVCGSVWNSEFQEFPVDTSKNDINKQ